MRDGAIQRDILKETRKDGGNYANQETNYTPHVGSCGCDATSGRTKDITIATHVHRGERGAAFCRLPDLPAVEIATLPGHALRAGSGGRGRSAN